MYTITLIIIMICFCSCGKNDKDSGNATNIQTPSTSQNTNAVTSSAAADSDNRDKIDELKMFKIKNGTLVKYLGNYNKEAEIVLPDSVKKIGKEAFAPAKNNKKKKNLQTLHLTIGKDVALAQGAFGQTGPMNIVFEEGRIKIEKRAFFGDVLPASEVVVTVPSSVKVLEEQCFYNAASAGILRVTLSKGLERIEKGALNGAFFDSIPASVRYIGENALGAVSNIETILPNGVETLERECMVCYGGKVTIPASIKSLAVEAITWEQCNNNDEQGYKVTEENPYYKSDENGWLYSKDGKTLYYAYRLPEDNQIIIPKGVRIVYKAGLHHYDEDYGPEDAPRVKAEEQVIFK